MAIPLSVVLLAFFNLCLNLIVVTIFALAAGVRPMLTWLEVPLIVALLVVLTAGLAMLLSSLFVYLRDLLADLGGDEPGPLLRRAGDHSDYIGSG